MPVPTKFDRDMEALGSAANGILLTLGTLHRAHSRDVDRLRRTVREQLQDFCNAVIDRANQ